MEHSPAEISRRRFARLVALASSFPLAATSAVAETVLRPETGNVILGPFYPLVKPRDRDSDLTLGATRDGRGRECAFPHAIPAGAPERPS